MSGRRFVNVTFDMIWYDMLFMYQYAWWETLLWTYLSSTTIIDLIIIIIIITVILIIVWCNSSYVCCSRWSSGHYQVTARQRSQCRNKGQCKYKKMYNYTYACLYKVINELDEHCEKDIDDMRWDEMWWLLIDDEDDVWIVCDFNIQHSIFHTDMEIPYEIKWRFSLVSF